MKAFYVIFAVLLTNNSVMSLSCYSGYTKILRWQLPSEAVPCPTENEYCYKGLVNGNILMQSYMAGCAKIDANELDSKNCAHQNIMGTMMKFCYCKGDLCNAS